MLYPERQASPRHHPHESPGKYLRLLGPSLAQVKDLPGIEIPEEGLDDLGALWETRSRQGRGGGGWGGGSQGWRAEVERCVGRRVGTVGTRPRQGRRVETELDFLSVPGKEEWGRSCNRTWEQLLRGGA